MRFRKSRRGAVGVGVFENFRRESSFPRFYEFIELEVFSPDLVRIGRPIACKAQGWLLRVSFARSSLC